MAVATAQPAAAGWANGLATGNGLNGVNGLNSQNGLSGTNGLQSGNGIGRPAAAIAASALAPQAASGIRAAGFPLAGRTGPGYRLPPVEPGVFEIACTDGGPGNCARVGYHPWRTIDQGVALLPFYNAGVLMNGGDYGGNDSPKTRNGMTSDIDDVLGMQPPESDPERLFEADWTDEGAVCTEAFARLHGALLVNRSRS